MSECESVTVEQLSELSREGAVEVIDVRTPAEYREVHASIARSEPLERLRPAAVMETRSGDADQPLYVICKGGSRSVQACRKFLEAGFGNVVNVEGGTAAWEQAGLPVVRGKKTVSLERQVRIVAGLLVLAGALLSFLNIHFVWLAAFIGAGLTFAGITDTCGMAMMLAKMPWNQQGGSGSCSTGQ